jgi:hypothetical protein
MRITEDGNVGIGTSTPVSPLSFANTVGDKITLWGNNVNNHYGLGIQGYLMQLYAASSTDNIAFGFGSSTNFTELMRVQGNGNVGIGTSNPANQMEVVGPASANPVTLSIANRGGFGPSALEFVSDYGLANQWRPGFIKSNDLGGFTGALEFYTNGTGGANVYGSVKGFEVRNGVAYTASGTVSSFSDARLKKDIIPFKEGLAVVTKINPVSFYYKENAPFATDRQQVGVLAQELETVAPYLVDKVATDSYKDLRSVNNQAYVFLLINAVKEQQSQIEQQKRINEDLQQQINELKTLLHK